MKYQIQKVSKADQNDREVLTEHDGLMNQAEQNAWFQDQINKLESPISDTHQVYIIVENHHWFKHDDPETSIATSNTDTSPKGVEEEVDSSEPADFATIAAAELAISAKRRKENYESEQKLKAAMAKLSSE